MKLFLLPLLINVQRIRNRMKTNDDFSFRLKFYFQNLISSTMFLSRKIFYAVVCFWSSKAFHQSNHVTSNCSNSNFGPPSNCSNWAKKPTFEQFESGPKIEVLNPNWMVQSEWPINQKALIFRHVIIISLKCFTGQKIIPPQNIKPALWKQHTCRKTSFRFLLKETINDHFWMIINIFGVIRLLCQNFDKNFHLIISKERNITN